MSLYFVMKGKKSPMKMEILSLGEKIKRKRKELNMTLRDLAGDRITPGQISLVESSKSNPSMDLLEYLACKLETTPEYLMEAEETQAEKICMFFQNVAETYVLQGDADNSKLYIEKATFYAKEYNLEYTKAKCLYLKGEIHILSNEHDLAQQALLCANITFNKLGKYEDSIKTFFKLGEVALILESYDLANTYFIQAEKVYEKNFIENDFLIGKIYYYIAYSYFRLKKTEKSIQYSYLAEEKFIEINNKNEHAKKLLSIAKNYSKNKELDKSILYSQKSLDIFKQLEDIKNTSEIYNNMGRLFSTFGKSEEAFHHLDNAKKIRRANSDPKIMDTLVNICEEYIKIKDIKSAKEILDEIMNEAQNGPKIELIKYYLLKYKLDMYEGNLLEAENNLIIGLNLSKSEGYKKGVQKFCMILGKYYLDKDDNVLATKYLSEGVESFKETREVEYV